MGVFHFKAEVVGGGPPTFIIRYYPEYIAAPERHGLFELDVSTWKARIVALASPESAKTESRDEHCVSALAFKLKKIVAETGSMASVAFFVA